MFTRPKHVYWVWSRISLLTSGGALGESWLNLVCSHWSWQIHVHCSLILCLKDESTLKTLYCSLVRSNLEYCSVVWCPFTKRNVNKLERIQRRATRFILKSNDPYNIRLHKLNLLTLEQRRFVDDVTFLFKTLNGHLDVDSSQFLDFYSQEDRYLLRHFDTKLLKKKYARTNILKNSYFYRIVDEWNSLPLEVRSSCNVVNFKAGVVKFVTKL